MTLPIFNQSAEDATIGCILTTDNSTFEQAKEFIGSEVEFFQSTHQDIWQYFQQVYNKRQQIELIETMDAFKNHQRIDRPFLTALCGSYPNANYIKQYAETVHKNYLIRTSINSFETSINRLKSGDDPKDVVSESMHENSKLLQSAGKSGVNQIGNGIFKVLENILESKNNSGISGLTTGYSNLDSITGGLQTGYYILAARPSVGKTTFAINIARNVTRRTKKSVLIFSLEMKAAQLQRKLLALDAGVDSKLFNLAREIDSGLEKKLTDAANDLSQAQIYLLDRSRMKASEIEIQSKQFKSLNPNLGLIVIDYIQLIEPEAKEGTTNDKTAETSRNIKIMSDELDLPVLALSQLKRATNDKNDKIPDLDDLRNSGSLEQDADAVMFLHRKDYFDPNAVAPDPSETDLLLKKNRLEGGVGAAKLYYYKAKQLFRDSQYPQVRV